MVAPGVDGDNGNQLALRSLIVINFAGHPAFLFLES